MNVEQEMLKEWMPLDVSAGTRSFRRKGDDYILVYDLTQSSTHDDRSSCLACNETMMPNYSPVHVVIVTAHISRCLGLQYFLKAMIRAFTGRLPGYSC
jgi:hypothetical protein